MKLHLFTATLGGLAMLAGSLHCSAVYAQDHGYRVEEGWAKLPDGRKWGRTSAVAVGPDGSVWAFERCGGETCAGSSVAPIVRLDASGRTVKAFGENLFVFPHYIHVDREGNVWVADAQGKDGKGHQVMKFSPDGKLLLKLGKPGVAGAGNDEFNQPSAVVTAPNGDVFVADGHGGKSNARIVKFSKDGKFIKTWGKPGSGPGDLNTPHAIAMDSQGRLFVGDRMNGRIQIFDQEGNVLAEWRQFGRPSGIWIDRNDTLYVADHQSDEKINPGFARGIRIGSARDGIVRKLVPGLGADPDRSVPEGVAADAQGNIYGAEVGGSTVTKYTLGVR
jgi:sugar lactone lactonase YvrE